MDTWHTCLACSIVSGQTAIPGGTLVADPYWVATLGMGLFRRGWVVISSRAHRRHLSDLTNEEQVALGPMVQIMHAALHLVVRPVEIYTCAFMAEVQHAHFHLIPRYAGDHRVGPGLVADMFDACAPAITAAEAQTLAEEVREAVGTLRMPAPSHLPLPPRLPHDQAPTAPSIPHPEQPSTRKMRFAVEDGADDD